MPCDALGKNANPKQMGPSKEMVLTVEINIDSKKKYTRKGGNKGSSSWVSEEILGDATFMDYQFNDD